MIKNIEVFETDPIPKAVFKLALPTVLSMIVTVFYNMVDTFFVGQIGDPNQVAAVSVATPVFLFLMAAGNIFGVGGSSFLSRALGEKKVDKVKHISSFCFYAGIAVGILAGALMLIFMTPILKAVGTSENTFGFAKDYLSFVAYGGPVIVVSTALTNLIRGEGDAKDSMIGMMAGTIANIILDPFFILPQFLGLGVSGAAIATVIGNAITLVFYMYHILFKKTVLSIKLNDFALKGIIGGVLAIGLPASLTNILMSLSNILTNTMLVKYGDIAVAAMGIAMKSNMLVIFIQLGLGIGIQPLVGYNFGAKNFKRMKGVMKFAMVCNITAGIILTAVYFVFAKQIVGIFINNQEVINAGIYMLRVLMISSPFIGIMFVFNFTFQAMGKAIPSLVLAISRQGIVFLPCIFILDKLFQMNGVIFAQPIADIIAVFISLGMFMYINAKLKKTVAE